MKICIPSLALALAAFAWQPAAVAAPAQPAEHHHLPRLTITGDKFLDPDGQEFKVWGLNYTGSVISHDLVDDNLDQPWKIEEIKQDFGEMSSRQPKDMQANVVRLHLQFNKFMNGLAEPNPVAIAQLKQIVALAEKNKLYLIITGLGAYRLTDQPDWYTNTTQEERWIAQANFWTAIAGALADNPTILGYDLMNEPIVPTAKSQAVWLPSGTPGDADYFVQCITRDWTRDWEPVMHQWIARMTAAVRAVDTRTPITVGFLNLSVYADFTPDLDYASLHLYPTGGQEDASVATIKYWQSTKPLVIEEYFPLLINGLGWEEAETFALENRTLVNGWVSHYFGKTIAEYFRTHPKDFDLANTMNWFIDFRKDAPVMKTP